MSNIFYKLITICSALNSPMTLRNKGKCRGNVDNDGYGTNDVVEMKEQVVVEGTTRWNNFAVPNRQL